MGLPKIFALSWYLLAFSLCSLFASSLYLSLLWAQNHEQDLIFEPQSRNPTSFVTNSHQIRPWFSTARASSSILLDIVDCFIFDEYLVDWVIFVVCFTFWRFIGKPRKNVEYVIEFSLSLSQCIIIFVLKFIVFHFNSLKFIYEFGVRICVNCCRCVVGV